MSAVAALLTLLLPVGILVAAIRVMDYVRRARADAIERQIAMTDAIHRELGATAAPTVTRSPFGHWRVCVAVPFERPAVVGRIVELARETLAPRAALGGRTWTIVLSPQTIPLARHLSRGARCAFDGAPSVIAAGRPYPVQLNMTTPRAT